MDIYQIFINFMNNLEFYVPITFSFIVVVLLGGVSFFLQNEQFRTFLLIPLALFFLVFSYSGSAFEQEFYLNMSTELFGALLTLLLFATFVTTDRWTFPVIVFVALMMLSFLFTIDFTDTSGISLNMSTELLGAMLTTVWLRRDWLWGSTKRSSFVNNRAFQQERRKNLENLDTGFQIYISGRDEMELEYKIQHLQEQQLTLTKIGSTEYDNPAGIVSCVVEAQMATASAEQDLLLMPTDEVRVRLIGLPDSTKRAYESIKSFLVCKEQKRIDTPEKEFLHLEFRVKTSRQ
jgi:hypothetical protein